MWKLYLKLDEKIISLIQDAYLWLLDRTGVYVGTVIFLNGALSTLSVLNNRNGLKIVAIMMFLYSIIALPRYIMQGNGNVKSYNDLAMFEEGLPARHIFLVLNLTMLLSPPYTVLDELTLICQQMMWYLNCLKIRDRDKKPFFEKKQTMVSQGNV